jgi:hypothetical protein
LVKNEQQNFWRTQHKQSPAKLFLLTFFQKKSAVSMRKKLTLAFFPSPSSSSPKKPLDESVPPFRCRNPIKRGEDDLASFLRRRNRRFFGVFQVPTIFLLLAFLPKSRFFQNFSRIFWNFSLFWGQKCFLQLKKNKLSLFSGHSSSTGDDGHIRTVSTPFGVLLGQTVRFSSSNAGTSAGGKQLAPVTQFLGVPYGMAPTGQVWAFNWIVIQEKTLLSRKKGKYLNFKGSQNKKIAQNSIKPWEFGRFEWKLIELKSKKKNDGLQRLETTKPKTWTQKSLNFSVPIKKFYEFSKLFSHASIWRFPPRNGCTIRRTPSECRR